MPKRIQTTILTLLRGLGAFDLLERSRWRNNRLLILCYHGVSLEDEHEWSPGLYMSPERFESRLRRLREGGYSVLPLAEALRRLYDRDLPPRSVTITFDDGPFDFYHRAHPLLEKYGLPATVYWTTFYAAQGQPVFPVACSYILWKGRFSGVRSLTEFGVPDVPDLRADAERRRIVHAIVSRAEENGLSADEKHHLLARLAERVGFDFEVFCRKRILQLMTAEEASELTGKGVDFQLHTHRHRVPLDEALFRREIRDNRDFIIGATGRAPSHFCYPSGVYYPAFLGWLKAEGVASATTCDPGLASPVDSPLLLPRFLDTTWQSSVQFESWLSGMKHFLARSMFRR